MTIERPISDISGERLAFARAVIGEVPHEFEAWLAETMEDPPSLFVWQLLSHPAFNTEAAQAVRCQHRLNEESAALLFKSFLGRPGGLELAGEPMDRVVAALAGCPEFNGQLAVKGWRRISPEGREHIVSCLPWTGLLQTVVALYAAGESDNALEMMVIFDGRSPLTASEYTELAGRLISINPEVALQWYLRAVRNSEEKMPESIVLRTLALALSLNKRQVLAELEKICTNRDENLLGQLVGFMGTYADNRSYGEVLRLCETLKKGEYAELLIAAYRRNRKAQCDDLFLWMKQWGRPRKVATALKTVVGKEPAWADAQHESGMALLRLNQFAHALPHFSAAVRLRPLWMSAIHHLGLCYLRLGERGTALVYFRSVVERLEMQDDPQTYSKSFELLGDLYLDLRKDATSSAERDSLLKELEILCKRSISKYGNRPWTHLYLGAILFARKKIDESLSAFELAAAHSNRYDKREAFYLSTAFGCYTVRGRPFVRDIAAGSFKASNILAPMTFDGEPPSAEGTRGPVFLIGCDANYFCRFAPTLIRSVVAANTQPVCCHFHIMDRNEAVNEVQNVIASIRGNMVVNYSFERTLCNSKRSFYAIARFIRAPEFMKLYRRDLLIGDCDSAVVSEIAAVKRHIGEFDVGINYTDFSDPSWQGTRKFPWNSIRAGFNYFSMTSRGVSFARMLADFILAVFDDESPKQWWIDQSALFSLLHFLSQERQDIKVLNLAELQSLQKLFVWPRAGQAKEDFVKMVEDRLNAGTWP